MGESLDEKVDDLFGDITDPQTRAVLTLANRIVIKVNQIDGKIDQLAGKVEAQGAKITRHEVEEMELIHQGRGMVRVALIALAIGQAVATYFFTQHMEAIDKIRADVDVLIVEMARHQEHHRQEEKYNAGPKVSP